MTLRHLLTAFSIALLLVAWPHLALAKRANLAFPVTIAASDAPDVVCAFARMPSSAAIVYGDLLANAGSKGYHHGWIFRSDLALLGDEKWPTKPAEMGNDAFKAFIDTQRDLLLEVHAALAASRALPTEDAVPNCSDEWKACAADVSQEIGMLWSVVLCADAPTRTHPANRVAFLGFDFHRSTDQEPRLRRLYFDGRVASVTFSAEWNDDVNFSVRSLGASYLEGEPRIGVGAGTTIELLPRCTLRSVRLPKLAHAPHDAHADKAPNEPAAAVKLGGAKPRSCNAAISNVGALDVVLPISGDATRSSLDIRRSSAVGDSSFRVVWDDPLPPKSLVATTTSLSFSWVPHCLYWKTDQSGAALCPDVDISDAGVTCSGRAEAGRCFYRQCALSDNRFGDPRTPGGVPLPLSAVFHVDNDRWTSRIVAIDQELRDYVEPTEYSIKIDARRWQGMPAGDVVYAIALNTPDSNTRLLQLRTEQSEYIVAVPFAHCSDNLLIRAVGQRRYDELPIPIAKRHVGAQGAISSGILLPGPSATAHRIAFGVNGGYGWLLPVTVSGIKGRNREQPIAFPAGVAGAWLRLRPARSSTYYELAVEFLYSDRVAYSPRIDSAASDTRIAYYRLPITLSVGHALVDRISAGLGAGIVIGEPFFNGNGHNRLFAGADFAGTVSGHLRLSVLDSLVMDLRSFLLFAEDVPSYDTDFKGDVVAQRGEMTSLGITLGLRWDIASGTLLPALVRPECEAE
jgi:hypothetical protein